MVIIIKPGTDILFLEELQTERTKLKPLYGKGDFFVLLQEHISCSTAKWKL